MRPHARASGRQARAETHAMQSCQGCAYYYITYDPQFPYGCRAMNFKSRQAPCKEVAAASGLGCQSWQPRDGA